MDIVNNIFVLLKRNKQTAKHMAESIGISTSNVTEWKMGRNKPGIAVLPKLARYFNVSTDYLLGLTDDPAPPSEVLSSDERAIIDAYRNNPDVQASVKKLLDVDM